MISLLFALCAIQSTALVFMFLRQRAFERSVNQYAELSAIGIGKTFRRVAIGGALLVVLSLLNRSKNSP